MWGFVPSKRSTSVCMWRRLFLLLPLASNVRPCPRASRLSVLFCRIFWAHDISLLSVAQAHRKCCSKASHTGSALLGDACIEPKHHQQAVRTCSSLVSCLPPSAFVLRFTALCTYACPSIVSHIPRRNVRPRHEPLVVTERLHRLLPTRARKELSSLDLLIFTDLHSSQHQQRPDFPESKRGGLYP